MSKELKRSKCIEDINRLCYHAHPNLETSGRYIKSLRRVQSLITDEKEKLKYEYLINRLLQKHIIFLQESIINSYGRVATKQTISSQSASQIHKLANSTLAVSENGYSLVDVDGLKKLKTVKKSVILKQSISLPCKVKSENQKYKFIAEIIVTPTNVLSYASYDYEYDQTQVNANHNVLLHKVGSGIKSSQVSKSNTTINSR